MRIALGSDHAGLKLRQRLVASLAAQGHDVFDCGCPDEQSVDYPDYGAAVGRRVAAGEADRGILVCGTGIGIGMAANKVPGIRAATVYDRFTTQMAREHNDANVLCLGARVLDETHATELADLFLTTAFGGERHARRVDKINQLDGCSA